MGVVAEMESNLTFTVMSAIPCVTLYICENICGLLPGDL